MAKRLVVIGGVAAGMSAAAKARRTDPDMVIEVYTNDEFISYAGCGLPYFIGNVIPKQSMLIARTIEQFAEQNIQVFTQMKVTKINKEEKTITAENMLSAETTIVAYDKLLIATGARPVIPPWEGVNLKGIFPLRTIHDSQNIRSYLTEYQPKRAVIIGGGYIGLEMVENLLAHNCEVMVVEQNEHIIPNMDKDMAALVSDYLGAQGVTVRAGESVTSFKGEERVSEVITDRGIIEADLVIMSVGVRPNSEIASEAGIELGFRGAIRVNNRMETNVPDIYAAGDCAATFHLVSEQEVYIPMGTTANKQGKTAGENLAGGNANFKGVLGTGIAGIIDMEISRTGLSEKECQALGIEYISQMIKSKTKAHYYPTADNIWVKLVVDKNSRRILGAQIVGFAGAAKRIDIIAAAITLRSTIEDIIDMDLAYSPPFSPVWDPILTALNQF